MKKWMNCLLLIAALSVGCSKSTALDRVTITRSGGPVPKLERTVTDRSIIDPLYSSLLALRPVPPGTVFHCPEDSGTVYRLTFFSGSHLDLDASARAGGCRQVTLSDGKAFSTSGEPGTEFWSLLAKAVGLPEGDLAGR